MGIHWPSFLIFQTKWPDILGKVKWHSRSHPTSCKYVSSLTPKTRPIGTWYTFKSMNRKTLMTATFVRLPLTNPKQLVRVSFKMLSSVAQSPFVFRVFSEWYGVTGTLPVLNSLFLACLLPRGMQTPLVTSFSGYISPRLVSLLSTTPSGGSASWVLSYCSAPAVRWDPTSLRFQLSLVCFYWTLAVYISKLLG